MTLIENLEHSSLLFANPNTYTTICWSFSKLIVIDAYVISHNEFVSANMLAMWW
jgi:hypothetical protein